MLLSGPPSVGDDFGQSRYQSLSSVQTVTGAQGRSHVLTGLLPGRLYAVAVAPYADSVDGAASNTVYLQTADDGTILYDTIREAISTRGVHGNGEDWDPMGPMGFPWEWELRRGNWQKNAAYCRLHCNWQALATVLVLALLHNLHPCDHYN